MKKYLIVLSLLLIFGCKSNLKTREELYLIEMKYKGIVFKDSLENELLKIEMGKLK